MITSTPRRTAAARLAAVLATLVAVLGIVTAGAGAASADPSPYCRPSLGTPSGSEKYVGSNQYTVTVTVTVTMTCNGKIYKGSAQSLLYYHHNTTSGSWSIESGSSCSSNGKAGCSTSAHYVFTAHCDDYTFVTAYGRLTGHWQQTSSSANNSISSGNGPTMDDYWTGDDVCP
jgi:hypothetical protein